MTRGRYFNWLMKLVDCDADKYGYLMVALFNKEYYWTIPTDENRSEDGKTLRDIFIEQDRTCKGEELAGPCSVLEMMIALARRWCVDIVSDDGSDDGFDAYFWEMIDNLGLKNCTNDRFVPEKVDETLNRMLDREYSNNGVGSLFPIKKTKGKQKTIEVWYQLQAYLSEKDNFE